MDRLLLHYEDTTLYMKNNDWVYMRNYDCVYMGNNDWVYMGNKYCVGYREFRYEDVSSWL